MKGGIEREVEGGGCDDPGHSRLFSAKASVVSY